MHWQSTAASWTAVVVAVGGAYWYYTGRNPRRRADGRRAPTTEIDAVLRRQSEGRSRSKKGKHILKENGERSASDVPDLTTSSVNASGNERAKGQKKDKKKGKAVVPNNSAKLQLNVDASTKAEEEVPGGDDVDDKEFARQMSSRKTGTDLAAPAKNNQRVRTNKQSKANDAFDEPTVEATGSTTASSTTGADAEDELSPAVSPDLAAIAAPVDPSGVSDMLEAPTPGASVLRLTPSQSPVPQKQPKKPKSAPEFETKKQRQNRAKNEAKKAERELAERERRVLLEKQLRTVREAEDRPAKNGAGWTYASGTTPNAWNKAPAEKPTRSDGELLDTFNPEPQIEQGAMRERSGNAFTSNLNPASETTTASKPNMTGSKGSSAGSAKPSTWDKELPSEEEQMRMLAQEAEDDQWETVSSRKATRAAKQKPAPTNQDSGEAKPNETVASEEPGPTKIDTFW